MSLAQHATLSALGGYGLGAIPFGLILTRAAGLGDIRQIGSGNIGATNVLRTGNKGLAATTLVLDAAKGLLAVVLARAAFGPEFGLIGGFAAIIGHVFPIWLGFRGGKGVATGFGVLLAVSPLAGTLALAVWFAVARWSRISSAGALAGFLAAPFAAWFFAGPRTGAAIGVISALIYLRHAENIGRLLRGTEPKVGAGREPPSG